MSGRVTSSDPSKNQFGIPFQEILALRDAAHQRLTGAMEFALKRWLAADQTRREKKAPAIVQKLRDAAIAATERALS